MGCGDDVAVDEGGQKVVCWEVEHETEVELDGVASPLEEVKVVVGRWVAPPLEV